MNEIVSVYDDKKNCCGCACCVNVCPQKAIQMVEDEYGFKYPTIDKSKCINCGLCKKNCRYQMQDKDMHNCEKVFAAITENTELIQKSASGGVFANIAKNFIKDNGIVYGCAMNYINEKLKVEHIRVDSEKELIKLQGSKYVQSDMGDTYKQVKTDLKEGKKVLFSGTPCQVDAVKEYLKKENTENLYCIDIICHGVPSNKMFNEYINLIENKYKGNIVDFKFRDKTKNWGLNALAIIKNSDGKVKRVLIPSYNSSYYQLFLDSHIYRENCYNCPYADSKRVGDITIGDYWKVENEHSAELKENKININNGVSCILVNNNIGKDLIEKYGDFLNYFKSCFEKVSKHNAQLLKPSGGKQARDKILEIYKLHGYVAVDKLYWKRNIKKILVKKCWYKLPLKIREKIR